MDIDEEIMQEFLVEAGELFDQLNDQFSELDNNREDCDLINAIFRAYHTIKGGAGFMKLTAMVDVCHRAEDIIDQLRQNKRQVTDKMIDVMFQVLDALDIMFTKVGDGETLEDADPNLIQQLDQLLSNQTEAIENNKKTVITKQTDKAIINDNNDTTFVNIASEMDDEFESMIASGMCQDTKTVSTSYSGLITDDEFEAALDAIHGKGKHKLVAVDSSKQSELITDDEFESALDKIHGKGKHNAVVRDNIVSSKNESNISELISDSEFDDVLDKMHGKGKGQVHHQLLKKRL